MFRHNVHTAKCFYCFLGYLYYSNLYIIDYIFLRESSRKICSYTPSCAIDKKSAWRVCSNSPKYSVHNNTLSIIFYIKINIFTILFLQNFNKIFSITHQIAPFLKIFLGSIPQDPPSMQYNT